MSDSLEHKSIQTRNQFKALRLKLDKTTIVDELKGRKKINKLTKGNDIDLSVTSKWLKNGWNTERILRTNSLILNSDENFFALQWSFPQAYYSIFCTAQAFFHSNGKNIVSHTATMKEISKMISQKYYPASASFWSSGGKNTIDFENISFTPGYETIYFKESIPFTIENQICQFLRSTREYLLDEKKKQLISDINKHPILKTQKGTPSEALRKPQWDYVSDKLGNTSILHLLYRKRIKSNYRDIDTFQFDDIPALAIHQDIIEIVSYLNFVHETFVYKCIGKNKFVSMVNDYSNGTDLDWLENRTNLITSNF